MFRGIRTQVSILLSFRRLERVAPVPFEPRARDLDISNGGGHDFIKIRMISYCMKSKTSSYGHAMKSSQGYHGLDITAV